MHTESWMFNSTCSILTVTDLVALVVVICDALHEKHTCQSDLGDPYILLAY